MVKYSNYIGFGSPYPIGLVLLTQLSQGFSWLLFIFHWDSSYFSMLSWEQFQALFYRHPHLFNDPSPWQQISWFKSDWSMEWWPTDIIFLGFRLFNHFQKKSISVQTSITKSFHFFSGGSGGFYCSKGNWG